MEHPGPPRFVAVGDAIELAPRDPDPTETYAWHLRAAPVDSTIELPDDEPVVEFAPDAPGTYELELDASDRRHRLTVRAFPGDLAPAGRGVGASGGSGLSGYQSGSARTSGESGGVSGSGSGTHSEGGGGGRPRLQLHGDVEGTELVVRADPQPHPDSDADRDDVVVEFLVDDRDDVDRDQIAIEGWELRIPTSVVGDRVRVHAVAVEESYSVPDTIEFARETVPDGGDAQGRMVTVPDASAEGQGSEASDADAASDGGHTAADPESATGDAPGDDAAGSDAFEVVRTNDPPAWSTDVTLYEIYVRGFAGPPEDQQADTVFAAIEERLDYLESLGVDCLWLTPVLQNDHAPHGYNITDFFSIAEDLGDREDYEQFVEAAHDHGMKVLFDLVMNHSARDHPFYQDAYRNPDSAYYDWYDWKDDGEPETYFEWEYIANWNFSNLAVRRHLLDAVDTWFEIADGFRCDMAWAVPDSFWRELRDRVKSRDRDFLLLDETIPYIADFHDGMFDMHFDTTLYFTLRQVGRGDEPASAILDAIDQRAEVGFPPHAAFMLYIENHDETRYVVECGDDAAMAAAGALVTLPGVPMLYGGQELGQRGRRDALAWDHAREAFHEHYERLLEVREEIPALGYDGDLKRVDYGTDSDRAVAFERSLDDEAYVCVLNFGESTATVTLDTVSVDPTDAITGESLATDEGLAVDDVAVFPVA
ncbi:alpha-amylase MalA [Halobellus clavatus]|uniref:Glycosidase n=1 Tax=Halobellus clavatus TaxID=660517 RepID=A0A1H3FF18_9EURY|nr:alpha-amylase MalA [Halobellus clavatus]SDX88719.1 Glycosidase [Halobellus clavatus]